MKLSTIIAALVLSMTFAGFAQANEGGKKAHRAEKLEKKAEHKKKKAEKLQQQAQMLEKKADELKKADAATPAPTTENK